LEKTIKRILLVFGTRPEAIKMCPLVKEFRKYPEQFETKVCVSGQHREMLDQVLELFEIIPDYDLNIMKSGQDLFDVTTRVLQGMREILNLSKPDMVFVHGDTSTSTTAAISAYYKQIPVAHVEAGLRTYNMYSPFPEEINRRLTGCIASYHFAPTEKSRQNLLSERIPDSRIFLTGNTVIDALQWTIKKVSEDAELKNRVYEGLRKLLPVDKIQAWQKLSGVDSGSESEHRRMVLITGHRRENFGEGFVNICEAIKTLSINYPDVDFVYPMHLNPNVRNAVIDVFGSFGEVSLSVESGITGTNLYLIEPLEYLKFVMLMSMSYIVLTDSGGIQEEAPGLGKPVLVMRDTTERPEDLEAGTVLLVGTDTEIIIEKVKELLDNRHSYNKMSSALNPYGDGNACSRIVTIVSKVFAF